MRLASSKNARLACCLPLLALMLSICSGCRSHLSNDHLQQIPGTNEVRAHGLALSMSPDGQYLFMVTEHRLDEDRPATGIVAFRTLDLGTGKCIEHLPSPTIDAEDAQVIHRNAKTLGFSMFFGEDGWHGGNFYLRGAPSLVFDPTSVYFSATHQCPTDDMLSSDCVDRAHLTQVERAIRESGTMTDVPILAVETAGGDGRSQFSAPAGTIRQAPVIYYIGYDNPGTVYRSDGTCTEVVFKNKPDFILADPALDLIKVSPDGKYLSVIYRKRMGLPVPSVGGAYELYVVELSGSRRSRCWSSDYFGSCIWDPKSENLYLVSTFKGRSVYRLNLDREFR